MVERAPRVWLPRRNTTMAQSSSSSTNQAGGSGSKTSENLDDLLLRLGIDEDEIDDLVIEDREIPKEG